jgi:type I restriction enzyme S subunit
MAPIKNTASPEPRAGYVPAFSASGQDVWLPDAKFQGPGLVLSAVGARCGKTFRADGAWAIVANTHVLLARSGHLRDYWWYVTNHEGWWERAGAAQPFVQVSKTLDRPWALPPLPEQAAIVRFLDHADRRIRRYIRAKQKLIKLLEEQKKAVVHQAVTRGLDPNVRLKPSGVEWLGDVPEHWEVSRARFVCTLLSAKAHEQFVEPNGEHICVTARFVSTDGRSFRRCSENFSPARRGDVLMVMSDLPRGRALARAYLVNDDRSYAVNQRVCILRPVRVHPQFLAFAANRHPELLAHDDGFNQTHLPNAAFKIMRLPLPPLDEQAVVAERLVRKSMACEAAVHRAQREIELLAEFRTRLIADVVTGKLDVRKAAARLPDEAEEPDLADELDTPASCDDDDSGEVEHTGEKADA